MSFVPHTHRANQPLGAGIALFAAIAVGAPLQSIAQMAPTTYSGFIAGVTGHGANAKFDSATYLSRNYRPKTVAAVMAGTSAKALQASARLTDIVTPDVARQIPLLEPLLSVPVQTLLSFGRWEEVLRTPLPPSDLHIARSHFWYARGIAFAAMGRAAEARVTIDSINAVALRLPVGESRTTLQIAARMIDGELSLRSSDAAHAVTVFTEAANLEDALLDVEPRAWLQPVRHSLGKALLAAGRSQDAEQVYLADLRRFPNNGWSLYGLAESLRAQHLPAETRAIEKRFKKAWRRADVKITSSHY